LADWARVVTAAGAAGVRPEPAHERSRFTAGDAAGRKAPRAADAYPGPDGNSAR